MGIELMELKTDGSYYEFILRETVMNNIVIWGCLSDADTVKEYLKEHAFPEDTLYSEQEFVEEVAGSDSYIHLIVQKRETAEFICDLCCELI